jgi:hypothetical protein
VWFGVQCPLHFAIVGVVDFGVSVGGWVWFDLEQDGTETLHGVRADGGVSN